MNGFFRAASLHRPRSAAAFLIAALGFAPATQAGQPPRAEVKPLTSPSGTGPASAAPTSTGPKSVTVAKPVIVPSAAQSPEYLKRLYGRYEAVRNYEQGDKHREARNWDDSFKAYAKARELYESIGEFDDAKESEWSLRVGDVEQSRGNLDAARKLYEAAIESDVRLSGEPKSSSLVALGYLEFALRRYEAAQKPLELAVEIDRRTKKPIDLSFSLQWLAAVRRAQSDFRQAATLFREASDLLREYDKATPVARAEPLRRLSRVLVNLGELPEALATAEEAASLFEQGLGAAAKDTLDERRHVEQITNQLSDREQRRHMPQDFARLQARFFELSEADRGKKRFYRDRSWWVAFEPERNKLVVDDGDPPFPDDGGWSFNPVDFRARLNQAALDVAHVQDLSDASLNSLREVLAGLEVIDGNSRAALDHMRALYAAKSRSGTEVIRVLNYLGGLEGYFGNDAVMLDQVDELYALSYRYDADFANLARAQAAAYCRDPALRERARRYLELARTAVHKSHGPDHWKAARICEFFADFYMRQQDPRGIAEADRMMEILRGKLPADAPLWKYVEFTHAEAYLKCGEPAKAEPMLEAVLAKCRADQEPDLKCVAMLQRRLARLDAQHGRKHSAERRYDEAVAALEGDRHMRYRLKLLTRERDDFLAGKLTPIAAVDPPEPLEDEPSRPTVTATRAR